MKQLIVKIKIQDGENQYYEYFKVKNSKEARRIKEGYNTGTTEAEIVFVDEAAEEEVKVLDYWGVI